MHYYKNKKCLITGAASGIGHATALALAKAGAQLALTDINEVALKNTANQVQALGGTLLGVFPLDISHYDSVKQMADTLHLTHGSMDVLMNIAGISTWGTIDKLQHHHWRELVEVNLMGPIHILELFTPAMMAAGKGGHVVNVSSAAGLFGLPWHAAYSATKFGLRGISEVLRFDLRAHKIHVSLVCPGAVDTGLVQTIKIVGIHQQHPKVQALVQRFQRHAVTPEKAAQRMLKGVRKKRYLVYTSWDIAFGHWFTRKCAWPYEWLMRGLSRLIQRTALAVEKEEHKN